MKIKDMLKLTMYGLGFCLAIDEADITVKIQMPGEADARKYTSMENVLKKEKIEEYKKLILEDKNLKLVFEKDELDKLMEKNINNVFVDVKFEDRKDEDVVGDYNTVTNNIRVKCKEKDMELNRILFHEMTHALFTRGYHNTGMSTYNVADFIERRKYTRGDALNEGGTEYISNELANKEKSMFALVYVPYVEIFKTLCMTYGEKFLFENLKNGPKKLAEQLEKDGVSFNELNELLDESKRNPDKEKANSMLSRAYDITRNLFIKKYLATTPEERFEMAKNVRSITSKHFEKYVYGYGSEIIVNVKELEKAKTLEDVQTFVCIDLYKNFINNHEISGNISKTAEYAVQSAINTILIGAQHIPLEDMKEMHMEEIKDEKDSVLGYVLKSNGKIISIINVDGEQAAPDKRYVEHLPGYEDARIGDDYLKTINDLEKNYQLAGTSLVRSYGNKGLFVLNTVDGTKFFIQDSKSGKITEFSVEDKFTLGDVVVEKNKDKNMTKKMTTKILQILGVKQKDTKLLAAGNNWNTTFKNNADDGIEILNSHKKINVTNFENDIDNSIKKSLEKDLDNSLEEKFRAKYKVDTTKLNDVKYVKNEKSRDTGEQERE